MKEYRDPGKKTTKMNQVFRQWPRSTVITQAWLTKLGVSSKLANWHVGSGWLVRFGPRAFSQPGDSVDWRGGLYALQSQLGMTVHVGGVTSLELQGFSHFVPLGERKRVILISDQPEQLPAWFKRYSWTANIKHRCLAIFKSPPINSTSRMDCGGYSVMISSKERAIMEEIQMARTNDDIDHILLLMEGLTTLRPDVVQYLLENCRSIKVKRVFLWSSEAAGHAWFQRLDISRINIGNGKRQIYNGGRFNRKYGITVPKKETMPDV